jgi:RsiW-degrading membrane proteinase PrsW (M82 family)
MKQAFWKSIPFWVVVVTNLMGILVLLVSAENVTLVNVIGQAILAVITTLGAANNPTNPQGFGANTPIEP